MPRSGISQGLARIAKPPGLAASAMMASFFVCGVAGTRADPLVQPPTFAADPSTKILSLLMVAKPKALVFPFGISTTGWVYEVCPRPAGAAVNACPSGTSVQPLGGVRLALNRGDTLKLRLVNQLPPVTDSKHCTEPGHADLGNNPTNIHTHGLLVEPHRAQGPSDAYGDYVFVEIRNPANHSACASSAAAGSNDGASAAFSSRAPFIQKICTAAGRGVPGAVHPDMDVVDTAAEYAITIGDTHPSGLFWFHPHLHGISMNQITAGMAGSLTVGAAADACADATCRHEVRAGDEQVLMLQDMQIDANGHLHDQQNAGFCSGSNEAKERRTPNAGASITMPATAPPQGACFEIGVPGRWFHTVNGQVYPSIAVGAHGSIWRMVNASASRSYALTLARTDTGAPLVMQVIAVDGVPVESSSAADAAATARVLGYRAEVVPCPQTAGGSGGVCVRRFQMMPSARIELRIINPTTTRALQANFQTAAYPTGPSGDDWPAISLASVSLAPAASDSLQTIRVAGAKALVSNQGALGQPATIRLPGTLRMVAPAQARAAFAMPLAGPLLQQGLRQAPALAIDPATQSGLRPDASCTPLPAGHRRRIYFGYTGNEAFGLGYVEVDQQGREVAGTARPVAEYDPASPTVCLPLAAGDMPARETWELVNLTGEDHNFHTHQARFRLVASDPVAGGSDAVYVFHDNIPVPRGNAACDGTLATAQAPGSLCRPTTTVVRITFGEIGDFVYHCHILEHEDGGMMAKIRVVPSE